MKRTVIISSDFEARRAIQEYHKHKEVELSISPRMWAVYKQLWMLQHEEMTALDSFCTFHTTISKFMQSIETEHPYKDFLTVHSVPYEVCYIDCSHDWLDKMCEAGGVTAKRNLLINFRRKASWQLSLALVWLPHKDSKIENAITRYGELP